jgi:superfamily II DNA or RNA helicase
MLNFRKIKKEYSPLVLKEGRDLFDKKMVDAAHIVHIDSDLIKVSMQVGGKFDNTHDCALEFDRFESIMIDSECNCPNKYDCPHLAASIFYLEEYLDKLIVQFSNKSDIKEKKSLQKTFEEAQTKEIAREDEELEKELIHEYKSASLLLANSPYFFSKNFAEQVEQIELLVVVVNQNLCHNEQVELQLALRLPFRSKPIYITELENFLECVRYNESMFIGNQRLQFSLSSFTKESSSVLEKILESAVFLEKNEVKIGKSFFLESNAFGALLSKAYAMGVMLKKHSLLRKESSEEDLEALPSFYQSSIEKPLYFSRIDVKIKIQLEYLEIPHPKILLKPTLILEGGVEVLPEQCVFFTSAESALMYNNAYYKFPKEIKRRHLQDLLQLRTLTIPEPLFGTFVENALPELENYAEVTHKTALDKFVTMPFTGHLKAICDLTFEEGELTAKLNFLYEGLNIPCAAKEINLQNVNAFITKAGILARNLSEEQKIIEDLFQDFESDIRQGIFKAKSNKKIVEFMTQIVPCYQDKITFHSPETLKELFIYDDTYFELILKEASTIDVFEVELKVHGPLSGIYVEQLWECLASHRSFIEMGQGKKNARKIDSQTIPKILVLDLHKLAPVIQVFDDIGLQFLENHIEQRPLWTLASLNAISLEGLPITLKMSDQLLEIQKSMLGQTEFIPSLIPKDIQAHLRTYQVEGVAWVERLRTMHLNGILADDMGLGKTLQAICVITQYLEGQNKLPSIIICPTSLIFNWLEEFIKFNPKIRVLVVDGPPVKRGKLIEGIKNADVIITSYSLLQKDVEEYKNRTFGYVILDEGQYIKNRETRNSRSVKRLKGVHKVILTGTPVENALTELWSLFDFLMPGLLSTYERFLEKYIRISQESRQERLDNLKRKLSPFLLRRMTQDVVHDLPPISEMVYYCHLTETQQKLYTSYVESARKELTQLVEKEGFDKVQIHVLATLTRLKQICCHPAIFAKEKVEAGDSGKYDMLMELLQTLFAGGHKVVLFSQYTKMLKILKAELLSNGQAFEYLDGASKNRMEIVKRFNSDSNIHLFLVSLKAGGTGLNITGADVVIHYDMWWNPAIEEQATKRAHRIGQDKPVSVFKLVTKGTIEENIMAMQERKKGLVKKVIASDEEAVEKLTWEEVLELLQT